MATELQELLSQTGLETSSPASGDSSPEETNISSICCPIDHGSRIPALAETGQFQLQAEASRCLPTGITRGNQA